VKEDERPIGVFDSGVGGLSILREITSVLPDESILYLADQRWSPYGRMTIEEVRDRSLQIASGLIAAGAKTVVVACNSASAAGLYLMRQEYPGTPFVGLEPAVKPAALQSSTGVVGVLATQATFQGELFASVVDRHAANVTVIPQVGTGLAGLVEQDRSGTSEARELLADYLQPLLDSGMDTLVLGCTHYPFLIEDIRAVVGETVAIVDPSPAVARQVVRVLGDAGIVASQGSGSRVEYATTGDSERFAYMIERLLGETARPEPSRW
jgi:glutamate racemase